MKKPIAVAGSTGRQGKKPILVASTGKKKIAAGSKAASKSDIGLSDADCICATMAPHCPVHSAVRAPAVGQDVIR